MPQHKANTAPKTHIWCTRQSCLAELCVIHSSLVVPLSGKMALRLGVHLQVQKEGNTAIIVALTQAGALLKHERYPHKYPYDWRTKQPTIFRATDQVRLCMCQMQALM